MQICKNTIEEKRIQDTKTEFERFDVRADNGQFQFWQYDDILEVLKKTTVSSLKMPTIASAEITHYQSSCADNDSLLFHLAWIESMPSIDGARIRAHEKSIDIRIHSYGDRDGLVLFFDRYLIFQNELGYQKVDELFGREFSSSRRASDSRWQEWAAILEGAQTGETFVSLLRRGRVVSKEHPLKQVPAPPILEDDESIRFGTEMLELLRHR